MIPLRALGSLVKPRIVALLSLTGAGGLFAAGGGPIPVVAGFLAAGGCIAAGSATINCWYDRELDRLMERTADRPLPAGDLDHRLALAFGCGLLVAGTAIGTVVLPARSVVYMWLGAAAYVGLYTILLKRRHPIGVVLGGSAGSFPVLAGWAAVRPVTSEALLMAAVVFVWTPAHAWALATVYREDFAAAGVPTLPAVAAAERVQAAVWWAASGTVVVALALVPFAGPVYAITVLVGSPLFLFAYHTYRVAGGKPRAVRAFFTSNGYLAVLVVAWGVSGVWESPPAAVLPAQALGTAWAMGAVWYLRPSLNGVVAAPGPGWRPALRGVRRRVLREP